MDTEYFTDDAAASVRSSRRSAMSLATENRPWRGAIYITLVFFHFFPTEFNFQRGSESTAVTEQAPTSGPSTS